MILEHFLLSENETNCYVIACSKTGQAALIDPGEWNSQMADFIRQQELLPRLILITHNHHDHTGGIEAVKSEFDVRVLAHENGCPHDETVKDSQIVELGELKIKVLETPGHTDDSLTFVLGCDVFCGDLLFAGSVGGVPDRMSYDQEISAVREKILPLGDDMVLHPGHGPATTVQLERCFNPFLML